MEKEKEKFMEGLVIANQLSGPITLDEARTYHINYLELGPYVYADIDGKDKIVHSFMIERSNLETLYQLGTNGIRLYFCREDEAKDYLNIIAVPVTQNGDIDVRTILAGDNVNKSIVNTLEPCPNICGIEYSENDLNCREKDDVYYWLKPNNETQDNKVWFTNDGSGPVAVDKPEPPYDE